MKKETDMAEQMILPEEEKMWTWDHVNEGLRRIAEGEQQIEEHRVTADRAIQTIKEAYETSKAEKNEQIKTLTRRIKRAFGKLRKGLGDRKSLQLPYGEVGTREVVTVKFEKGLKTDDVIELVERHGFYDALKIKKRLLKEVLKAKGAEAMAKCGCHLARSDRFFIETTTEIEPEEKRKTA